MACAGNAVIEWIRSTDAHAERRLPFLLRAEQILTGDEAAGDEERQTLAEALERWRYHQLAHLSHPLVEEERRLVDALDDMARELTGRPSLPTRNVRSALAAPSDPAEIAAGMAALDPKRPIEVVSDAAAKITAGRFRARFSTGAQPAALGRRMLLYAPLYLSSYCTNYCEYCGFRYPTDITRRHLELAEALAEADLLSARGFRHILLVAGDFPRFTTTPYYATIVRALAERRLSPSLEIAPQSLADYRTLVEAGAVGVTLYQETYDERLYAQYHRRGAKAHFDWRLEGPERALEAGCPRIGLGVLVGLADPHADLRALMRHGRYLRDRFPDRTLAFSLPRIHEAPQGFQIPFPVDDELFVRMYAALRLAFPDAELVLSTREPAALRARLAHICITQMSAGSSTSPGGYCDSVPVDGQFPVTDHRSVAEVAAWLTDDGFAPVWTLA